MERFDGLVGAMAQPTGGQQYGDLVIVATGADGGPGPDAVWIGRVADGGFGWSGWSGIGEPAGGARPCRPAVGRGAGGLLEIVVVSQDGAVWHVREDGSGAGWSAWQSLGQPGGEPVVAAHLGARPPDPAPVLISHADESLEIFVIRNDFTVWHIWQVQPGGTWSGWESLGHPGGQHVGTVGPLVAGINTDGSLELFTTDNNGAVQYCRQLQASRDAWSDWESLGSPTGHLAGPRLAVVRNNKGELELFMVGPGGTLWHRWQVQQADAWSDWSSLGQPALGSAHFEVADVTVAADRGGGLVLWATSPAPEPASPGSPPWLWFRTQGRPGTPWVGWQEYPLKAGSTTTRPVEGPVLTVHVTQLVLLLRESDTANIYLVDQVANDVSGSTDWGYEYVPF